jgi:hypothetical protein
LIFALTTLVESFFHGCVDIVNSSAGIEMFTRPNSVHRATWSGACSVWSRHEERWAHASRRRLGRVAGCSLPGC